MYSGIAKFICLLLDLCLETPAQTQQPPAQVQLGVWLQLRLGSFRALGFGLPRPGNNYQHACFRWIRRETEGDGEGRQQLLATEATEPAALFLFLEERERMRLA